MLSGIFGGMTSTCCKLFLRIAEYEEGTLFLRDPIAWLFIILITASMIANLVNLNKTITLFSQLQVMPTYECCVIFGTLQTGGVILGEFSFYTNTQLSLIFLGSSICITGILWKICLLELDNRKKKVSVEDGFSSHEKKVSSFSSIIINHKEENALIT